MGMPDISIVFSKLAESARGRSARDTVCIITKDTAVSGLHTYIKDEQVEKDQYTDTTLAKLLKEGFTKYGVYKIIVYSISGEDATLDTALAAIKKLNYQWLAFNFKLEESEQTKVKEFKNLRLKNHAPIQVIAVDYAANDKFISNFTGSGIKVNGVAMEDYQFSLKVAFIYATLSVTKSATFYVLDDVTAADEIEDEDAAVNAGKLFITFDGEKYKLSRAVNSLTTLGTDEKASMKKVKVVSGMCLMHNDIFKTFRDEYCGQCENEYADRLRLIAQIGTYIKKLEGTVLKKGATNEVELDASAMRKYMEADQDDEGNVKVSIDTTDMTDDEVLQDIEGYCETKVFATGVVRYADAMEDFKLNLFY